MGQNPSHCYSNIWKALEKYKVSNSVKDIMMASWVPASKAQYEGAIKKWMSYCNQYDIHPLEATVEEGAEFLAHLFNTSKLKYSSMNTHRSALSALLNLKQGVTFGKHPLVCRLLRGMYKKRASIPRYTVTYDINIVLGYINSTVPNGDNSLETITKKLTTLMCILSGHRAQTMGILSLEYMHLDNSSYFLFSRIAEELVAKVPPSPSGVYRLSTEYESLCGVNSEGVPASDRAIRYEQKKGETLFIICKTFSHRQELYSGKICSRFLKEGKH